MVGVRSLLEISFCPTEAYDKKQPYKVGIYNR